jgi:hypothetical protein
MAPSLLWLILVVSLLITVVKYLMGIIMRLSFPSTIARKDYRYEPTARFAGSGVAPVLTNGIGRTYCLSVAPRMAS